MYRYKWKPSKTEAAEFGQKMEETKAFCDEHDIRSSARMDSYYFCVNGTNYRVSNHSVESSNDRAFRDDPWIGTVQTRELYHPDGREPDVVYIHASKTRLIEIYTDLMNGYKLNEKGNRV